MEIDQEAPQSPCGPGECCRAEIAMDFLDWALEVQCHGGDPAISQQGRRLTENERDTYDAALRLLKGFFGDSSVEEEEL